MKSRTAIAFIVIIASVFAASHFAGAQQETL